MFQMLGSTPLPSRIARLLGWVITMALPLAAEGESFAQQEYQAVLRSTPDAVHGEQLFETCAACHGTNGAGVREGTIPAIAAQPFRVVVRQLVNFRHNKRWDEHMQHFTNNHHLAGAQDIADVAAYIGGLSSAHASGQGSGEHLERAANLYAKLCAACHGASAEGNDGNGSPRLAGQHYVYLLSQLDDAKAGRRPDFPPEHVRLDESIGRADLMGVADYLSRLGH
jgi:cytochrome c553